MECCLRIALLAVVLAAFASCAAREYVDRSVKHTENVDDEITVDQVPVKGFPVTVELKDGDEIKGELLAVDDKFIWVKKESGYDKKVPVDDVTKVVVELYSPSGAGPIGGWAVAGTLSALSHGVFFVFTGPVWLLAGVSATVSAATSNDLKVGKQQNMVQLYQFARYPQGWPLVEKKKQVEKTKPAAGIQTDAGPPDDRDAGPSDGDNG